LPKQKERKETTMRGFPLFISEDKEAPKTFVAKQGLLVVENTKTSTKNWQLGSSREKRPSRASGDRGDLLRWKWGGKIGQVKKKGMEGRASGRTKRKLQPRPKRRLPQRGGVEMKGNR